MAQSYAAPRPPSSKLIFGHPVGLMLLFFTEMWERFSYYGMRALLILYLTKSAVQGGLGYEKEDATLLYGYFTGFVYFTPIIGGWLADNFLGQRRAILIGGLTMMIGQFSLAATPQFGIWSTYLGLLCLILGNGFFKPNISSIVGSLYAQGDPRRDAAFTIFYMGINLGALFAPLVCGFLAEDYMATKDEAGNVVKYAFEYGFLAAGIGMMLGQIMFNTLSPRLLGDLGTIPTAQQKQNDSRQGSEKLSKEETDRMAVIFVITIFVTFFWAGFEQAGSSLSLYTDQFIDRRIDAIDWLIPTAFFQALNPLFIVTLGSPIAALWIYLASHKKDLSVPVKMGIGMLLLAIGFLFMVGAVMERDGSDDPSIKAHLGWLVATYFFHTVGELCLSPIGLSMITRLAPIQYVSMLMGVWFLSPFVAQIIGGYIAKYVEVMGALQIFAAIAAFVGLAGLVMFVISRKLITMMHGRG